MESSLRLSLLTFCISCLVVCAAAGDLAFNSAVTQSCGGCVCDVMSSAVRCFGEHVTEIPQNLDPNITYLNIQDTSITVVNSTSLSRYTQLTHLYLKRNPKLTEIKAGAFSSNAELTKLAITDNPSLNQVHDDAFSGSFHSLRTLNLSSNSFTKFPKLGKLQILGSTMEINLYLDNNPISDPTPLCEGAISSSTGRGFSCRFIQVSIMDTKLSVFTKDILKDARVTILNISHNSDLQSIERDTFTYLTGGLHTLDMSNCPKLTTLPSAGLKDLKNLSFENCPALKTIPPTVDFVQIQKVTLTYPQHCCAFKRPELQDRAAYDKALRNYKDYRCKQKPEESTTEFATTSPLRVDMGSMKPMPSLIPYQIVKRELLPGSFGDYVTPDPDEKFKSEGNVIPIGYPTEHETLPVFIPQPTIDPSRNHNITFTANCTEIDFERLRDQMTCTPNENSFTPCGDIFEDDNWLRVLLWVVAVSAVIGNCVVLSFTILSQTKSAKSPTTSVTRFLICNLAFADFMLGIYLLTLAIVDIKSLGQYFNYANWWQYEGGCDGLGFITVFASELSVFTLAVITMERWYAIRYAIHLTKRVKIRTAVCIMAVGWVLSLCIAMLPLPVFGFSSYQQTSLCLPFRFETVKDQVYILFLLAFNISAFILVFCCYVSIFCQVRGSNAAMASDTYLARRMALLVFTDFICWGPVATVAGLSAGGINLQDSFLSDLSSLYVAKILLVIFYPFNACSNPFLYAIFTKQFQKDCIMTLTRCGLCKRKANRLKYPYGDHSDYSQYSTNKIHPTRQMSNTTQSTFVTQHHLEYRSSITSKSLTDPLHATSKHRRASSENERHLSSTLREYAMKVFNHQSDQSRPTSSHSLQVSPRKGSMPFDHSGANTLSCSASTIDSLSSRRPSDVVRVPETLKEDDSVSYDDTWQSHGPSLWQQECCREACYADIKMSDHDSGTELNNMAGEESDSEDPLLSPVRVSGEYEVVSDSESGYRGRSTCEDDISGSNGSELCKKGSVDEENNIKITSTEQEEDETSNLLKHNNNNNNTENSSADDLLLFGNSTPYADNSPCQLAVVVV